MEQVLDKMNRNYR